MCLQEFKISDQHDLSAVLTQYSSQSSSIKLYVKDAEQKSSGADSVSHVTMSKAMCM